MLQSRVSCRGSMLPFAKRPSRSTTSRVNATSDGTPKTYPLPNYGLFTISPMEAADLSATGVCIVRAFVGTPEQSGYSNVTTFLEKSLKVDPAKALCLVARAERRPGASSSAPSSSSSSEEGGQSPGHISRVVGAVSLSFSPDTRDEFETLQPPTDGAYLCNMGIDKSFRRMGVASRLIEVCVEETRKRGLNKIYLHVAAKNSAAISLYAAAGFKEVSRDGFMAQLRGINPRVLMRKDL